MKRSVSVDIALTPWETEEEVWSMDSENQVELLKCFVWRLKTKGYPVRMQMQSIHDAMKVFCDKEERDNIISLVSEFLEYLKGE